MSILFITGAGLSAPSGIPTYRGDTDSKYNDEELMSLVNSDNLEDEESRAKIKKHLENWKETVSSKEPNEAHHIISDMVQSYGGLVITQNVDNLQEKTTMDNNDIFHLHGSLFNGYREDYPDILDVVLFNDECKELSLVQERKYLDAEYTVLVGTSLTVLTPLWYIDFDKPLYIIDKNAKEVENKLRDIYSGLSNITCIEKDVVEGLKTFQEIMKHV